MATKTELDKWLMDRYDLDASAARAISNAIDDKLYFRTGNNKVYWDEATAHRPEPNFNSYPTIALPRPPELASVEDRPALVEPVKKEVGFGTRAALHVMDYASGHWDDVMQSIRDGKSKVSDASQALYALEERKLIAPNVASDLRAKLDNLTEPESKAPWQMTKQEFEDANYDGEDVTGWNESPEKVAADKLIQESQVVTQGGRDKQNIEKSEQLQAAAQAIADKFYEEHDHETQVKQAIKEGKPVPTEVSADYPELQSHPIVHQESLKADMERLKQIWQAKDMAYDMAINDQGESLKKLEDEEKQILAKLDNTKTLVKKYDEMTKTSPPLTPVLEDLRKRLTIDLPLTDSANLPLTGSARDVYVIEGITGYGGQNGNWVYDLKNVRDGTYRHVKLSDMPGLFTLPSGDDPKKLVDELTKYLSPARAIRAIAASTYEKKGEALDELERRTAPAQPANIGIGESTEDETKPPQKPYAGPPIATVEHLDLTDKSKNPQKTPADYGREAYAKGIGAYANDKEFLEKFIAGHKVGDEESRNAGIEWNKGWQKAHDEATKYQFEPKSEPVIEPNKQPESKPKVDLADAVRAINMKEQDRLSAKGGTGKMILFPKDLAALFPNRYATEKVPEEDKVVIAKFFHPLSHQTWYATEYDPKDREFFGYVDTGDADSEWGYFSLDELEDTTKGGLHMERDLYFKPEKISEVSGLEDRFGSGRQEPPTPRPDIEAEYVGKPAGFETAPALSEAQIERDIAVNKMAESESKANAKVQEVLEAKELPKAVEPLELPAAAQTPKMAENTTPIVQGSQGYRLPDNMIKYIRAIKNEKKSEYANKYAHWLLEPDKVSEPDANNLIAGKLSAMGAQAVRMRLDELKNPTQPAQTTRTPELLSPEPEGKLTTEACKGLPASDFAEPAKRKYPIEDESHARNALARVSQHGTPAEKEEVREAVHEKYPEIKVSGIPEKPKHYYTIEELRQTYHDKRERDAIKHGQLPLFGSGEEATEGILQKVKMAHLGKIVKAPKMTGPKPPKIHAPKMPKGPPHRVPQHYGGGGLTRRSDRRR